MLDQFNCIFFKVVDEMQLDKMAQHPFLLFSSARNDQTKIGDRQQSVPYFFTAVMEQHFFLNVNNCLNTKTYSYLETSGGQSSKPYLNFVPFFNTRVN